MQKQHVPGHKPIPRPTSAQRLLRTAGVVAVSMVASWTLAGPAYPLKLVPGKHYVVDQNNVPVFIQGDSAWLLSKNLTAEEQDYYLSNRWAQGFNAVIMDMHPYYSGGVWGGGGAGQTADVYGNIPFTNTIAGPFTNLLAVNEKYLANVDHAIQRAASYGICVFLYPMYDGYKKAGEGWWEQMVGNGSNVLYRYGQFVGNRYKNVPNIVYVGAGDFNEPNPPDTLWSAIAHGILSVDTNHLFTAQAAPNLSARSWYSNDWCNLNCSYARKSSAPYITYDFALANYQVNPVVPSVSREPYYEDHPVNHATPLDCRQYAWGSVLYGEAGHFYGNAHIATYCFDAGWQARVWSEGAITITNVIKLMRTRPWWNCVPDANHATIISGYGNWGSVQYITCTREVAGRTIMAYIPQDKMAPTVDMTKVSGPTANAWWYNPRNGEATAIGSYSTTGTHRFTPPDANDWVLVLDDASAGFPPPGGPLPENAAPTVDAGANLSVPWPSDRVALDGTVSDDGQPVPPGTVTLTWTKLSGPGNVEFLPSPTEENPIAVFGAEGKYVLKLTASDGELSAFDEVEIVLAPNPPPSAPVNLKAFEIRTE